MFMARILEMKETQNDCSVINGAKNCTVCTQMDHFDSFCLLVTPRRQHREKFAMRQIKFHSALGSNFVSFCPRRWDPFLVAADWRGPGFVSNFQLAKRNISNVMQCVIAG